MWAAARYFPNRYFAPRYWPKVGAGYTPDTSTVEARTAGGVRTLTVGYVVCRTAGSVRSITTRPA